MNPIPPADVTTAPTQIKIQQEQQHQHPSDQLPQSRETEPGVVQSGSDSTSPHRDAHFRHLLSAYLTDALNDPDTAAPSLCDGIIPEGFDQLHLAPKRNRAGQNSGREDDEMSGAHYVLFEGVNSDEARKYARGSWLGDPADPSVPVPSSNPPQMKIDGTPTWSYLDLRLRQNRMWAAEQCQRGRELSSPDPPGLPDYEGAVACYREALSMVPDHVSNHVAGPYRPRAINITLLQNRPSCECAPFVNLVFACARARLRLGQVRNAFGVWRPACRSWTATGGPSKMDTGAGPVPA